MEASRPVDPATPRARRTPGGTRTRRPAPTRFLYFVRYFKSYVGAGALLSAALPIPVRYFHVIPMYAAQASFMTVYVTLFCFLLVSFIFYSRHSIARWMFRNLKSREAKHSLLIAWFPLVLALVSVVFLLVYHLTLQISTAKAMADFRLQGVNLDFAGALKATSYDRIEYSILLMGSFLLTFVAAETAFALMAIREYLQDILGLDDSALLQLNSSSRRKM